MQAITGLLHGGMVGRKVIGLEFVMEITALSRMLGVLRPSLKRKTSN
jgi:hypothetical protein